MIRRIALFLIAALLTANSTLAQVPIYTKGPAVLAAPGTSSNPIRITVLGASESARSAMADKPWPTRLGELINEGGSTNTVIDNLGFHGASFFQANTITTVYGSKTMVQEAIAGNPDIVYVSFGGNDVMNAVDLRTIAQVKADADTLFSTLRASLPSALIIAILPRAHDQANFPTPAVTLKNKAMVTQFMETATVAGTPNLWTNEMLETGVSAAGVGGTGGKTRVGDLESLATYINTGPSTAFNVVGVNWIRMDFWKLQRLGCTLPDMAHHNVGCQQWMAASVYKQSKALAAFQAKFPRLSNQIIAEWQDPDVFFTHYLTASGDGYVRSGTELVTNGAFAADTNWNKSLGVTIGAGVMAFDGVTSMASGNVFLSPIVPIAITVGQTYFVTYTIVGGTTLDISSQLGGVAGTGHNAPGTYTDTITAVSTTIFAFTARTSTGARTGSIDNVSITTTPADAPGLNGADMNRFWGDQTLFSPEEWYLPWKTRVSIWPPALATQNSAEFDGTFRIILRGGPPTQAMNLSIDGAAFFSVGELTDTHGNFETTVRAGVMGLSNAPHFFRFKCGTESYGPYTITLSAPWQESIQTTDATATAFTLAAAKVVGSRNVTLKMTGITASGALTTPTGPQIIAAIPNVYTGQTYRLRVINNGGAFTWTFTANATGVTLLGTAHTIPQNTWREYEVKITSGSTVTFESIGTGTWS